MLIDSRLCVSAFVPITISMLYMWYIYRKQGDVHNCFRKQIWKPFSNRKTNSPTAERKDLLFVLLNCHSVCNNKTFANLAIKIRKCLFQRRRKSCISFNIQLLQSKQYTVNNNTAFHNWQAPFKDVKMLLSYIQRCVSMYWLCTDRDISVFAIDCEFSSIW